MSARVVCASASQQREASARAWLLSQEAGAEVLVVGASADAASDLVRAAAATRGASFGWHRATLGRLAAVLAGPGLVEAGLVPVGRLAAEAVVARVVHVLAQRNALGRYADVAAGPGFARAAAGVLNEVRAAGLVAGDVADEGPELAAILDAYEVELGRAGLADRARVFALASQAAAADPARIGLPTLLFDVAVESAIDRVLVEALVARAPDLLATVPVGDARTLEQLGSLPGVKVEERSAAAGSSSLHNLQNHVFEGAPPPVPLGDDVVVLSAPGESRECVEIARRIHALAREGTPFDRIAILLRSPQEYRPHLEEALTRADVPAHFAKGAVQPDPAGRAFLALLACAAEGLSAERFAEYLSLGEVPRATEAGEPPPAAPSSERWVLPDEELVPEVVASALADAVAPGDDADESEPEDGVPVTAGTLRAPRHWEKLLVEAAVIGGRERWVRRLDGLVNERRLDAEALEDPDDERRARIGRDLDDLEALRSYALPLLDDLAALPSRASWGAWQGALSALATRALRRPDRVLATLSELTPMAEVGPVDLNEVRLVLSRRLLELQLRPSGHRYGKVFIAPADASRGMSFDVVFVPGLAERLFPRDIDEEPILLDAVRRRLGGGLVTREDRVARERLTLRLAVGAATKRVVLSYPRLDLEKSRPRVPSFYALEALRAAEGRLPGFDELAAKAERLTDARVGWPAPRHPEDAIDEAEHDLALLENLLQLDSDKAVGTARYLLSANPHLARALRFRARRWLTSFTPADGLVKPSDTARAAIAEHRLSARSFSPTALQHFAACPYKFFLQAVLRLQPREVPEAIEELPPLERGSLVHDTQFELFSRLSQAGLLPVRPPNLNEARAILDDVLDEVAQRYRDDLAPAIPRVWEDGVASVRADLREWLRRAAEDTSGFVPWRFELAFGLSERRGAADPSSQKEPVTLDNGLQVRGSVDLFERRSDGTIRATDHKTGKARVEEGAVVEGGEALQPVLYALAAEKLFPGERVESGRLYYCTATGGFAEVTVPLDRHAREAADVLAEVVGSAVDEPFLPAAPDRGKCRWCDYNVVCGPYEELRTHRKRQDLLEPLLRLRGLS